MPLNHGILNARLAAIFTSNTGSNDITHADAAADWDSALSEYVALMPTTYGPATGPPLELTGILTGLFSSYAPPEAVCMAIATAMSKTVAGASTPSLSSTAPCAPEILTNVYDGLIGIVKDRSDSHTHAGRASDVAKAIHKAFSSVKAKTTPPPVTFPPPPGSLLPT
jgi:hypothetical protein